MTRSTLFTFVFLILLAAMGYLWYGYWVAPARDASSERARFVRALGGVRRFRSINPDLSLFDDRFFRALEDPRPLPQTDTAAGRADPFAPFR